MTMAGPRSTKTLTLLVPVMLALACGDDGEPMTTGGTTSAATGTSAGPTTSAEGSTTEPPADSTGTTTTGPADSTTDPGGSSSEGGESSTGPGVGRCPPEHVCFILDGVFHVPDEAEPTAIYDIPLPPGAEYSVVEVTLDVTHGGWHPEEPAGLHNLFWLHRGTFENFTWVGGVLGYVNTRGPGIDIIRTRHDLDVMDLAQSQTFNVNNVVLQPDHTYRVFYRYDAAGGEVLVELTENGEVVASGTDVPTTDLVRNTEGGYFIWFANPTDTTQPGPEVPSLGWTYADLRVEFIP